MIFKSLSDPPTWHRRILVKRGRRGPRSGDLCALPSCSSPWKQDPPFGPLLQVMSALHCDSLGDPHPWAGRGRQDVPLELGLA